MPTRPSQHRAAASSRPTSGRRQQNKEKTKQAILKVALELLSKKGFYRTATKEISRKAGIAEGTLFNYFRTKEDLAMYFMEDQIAGLIAWFGGERQLLRATLAEQLFAIIHRHLECIAPYEESVGAVYLRMLQPISKLHPDVLALRPVQGQGEHPCAAGSEPESGHDHPQERGLELVKDNHPKGAIHRGLRMGKLGFSLVGNYLGYQVQNLLLGSESREQCQATPRRRVSRRVREELAELKGPLMKFGQLLSMQTHMLPDESIEGLSNLQMRAPGMHPTLARAQFKSSLARYPEEVFREFEPEPFTAASLGQVHRATNAARCPVWPSR
ncbi:MAG: TetR family transcriptional regulator [Planctomycetota bacterium]|nr:TetR family transcriptional regulator [Planctomycetota bacterium]